MGILGLDHELTSIRFLKNVDRYKINTDGVPAFYRDQIGVPVEMHHNNGIVEWDPKSFTLISAAELFKDALHNDGTLNREYVQRQFEKWNPLNAKVAEYEGEYASYFEKGRHWTEEQIGLGKNVAYAGTIFLWDDRYVIISTGIVSDGFWNASFIQIHLDNKEKLSNTYCPVVVKK